MRILPMLLPAPFVLALALGHATSVSIPLPFHKNCGAAHIAQPVAFAQEESEEEEELDLRDVVQTAKISLTQAIVLALKEQSGVAVEAGIEGEVNDGKVEIFYEIMIKGKDNQLHEVKVSHLDGKVLENSVEDDEEELEELREFNKVLRHSELSLTELIASAKGLINGKAAFASLEIEDGRPECEVLVAQGRYLVDVDVEARAGHIVEIELVGAGHDDSDQDGQECDDDGDDDHDD